VEPGKTYLLRIVNAALFSEYYLKVAGHKFTVVAADASYVSPYTTDIIAIAPGQTFDALVVADASPGKYYMFALPVQPPKPDYQSPVLSTRGVLQYSNVAAGGNLSGGDVPMSPEMPDNHNNILSFYFHGNLTSLKNHPRHPPVPKQADERMLVTLGLGSVCRHGQSCKRGSESNEVIVVATMNNMSYELPDVSTPLLEAHYKNPSNNRWLQELPSVPPRVFNFTDHSFIATGPKEEQLEPTSKAALAKRFRYGAVVDVVFQGTSILQSESNPMHLHGHNMFVLAQGQGNYDMARDVVRYNLVNPPLVNTVLVPRLGWVAVRFVADNPGMNMIFTPF
jgi:laccase